MNGNLTTPGDLATVLNRWLAPLGPDLPLLYLVGGALRDRLLGRPMKDIDLMCAGPEQLASRIARQHGAALVPFRNKVDAPCFRVVRREDAKDFIDLVPMRGGSPEADLRRRDFTINAMAAAVGPGGCLADVIDPLNGRQDLAQRRIRAASQRTFADDPLRILRAVRFAAQLDFAINDGTAVLMAHSAPALSGVAAERICAELLAILEAPAAVRYLRLLDQTGALAAVLPEISAMKGCTQNAHHHLDVWDHSLAALEACEAILADAAAHFGSAAAAVDEYLAAGQRSALLKLAVLLHDSGKPSCKTVDPASGRIHFRGHAARSAELMEAAGRRLRLPLRKKSFLVALAAHHMHVLALSDPGVRPATVLSWCRRLGDACLAAIVLSLADVAATCGPAAGPVWREQHVFWARTTARAYLTDFKPRFQAPPLISGHDLKNLGIAPGPQLGRILAQVRDAQQTGAIRTREAALDFAVKHWRNG